MIPILGAADGVPTFFFIILIVILYVISKVIERDRLPSSRRREPVATPLREQAPFSSEELETISYRVASGYPGSEVTPGGGFRFTHRAMPGIVRFVGERTEIIFATATGVREAIEVLPVSFWNASFELHARWGEAEEKPKFRVAGSRAEFERIFDNHAKSLIFDQIGAQYEWRANASQGLILTIKARPGADGALRHWVRCAVRLLDTVVPRPPVEVGGVLWSEPLTTTLTADTVCQICGGTLAQGAVVRCARCSTPHHEECWSYAGRCSTYGCPEKRYSR